MFHDPSRNSYAWDTSALEFCHSTYTVVLQQYHSQKHRPPTGSVAAAALAVGPSPVLRAPSAEPRAGSREPPRATLAAVRITVRALSTLVYVYAHCTQLSVLVPSTVFASSRRPLVSTNQNQCNYSNTLAQVATPTAVVGNAEKGNADFKNVNAMSAHSTHTQGTGQWAQL